ncbi:MAG: hypothetical protein QNJ60_13535 [Xenococcaceae cyanobacterium MO_188.B19]|nr:hypothetical protein [Xenococcaceae cyanobacterium MO_188.B19]
MKLVVSTVQVTALINLVGSSLIVGLIWFGWGYQLLDGKLGLIFIALFVSSIMLCTALAIIHLRIIRKSHKIKLIEQRSNRRKHGKSLEREFLKEQLERTTNTLETKELKKFIVDYVLLTQDLINKSNDLQALVDESMN